MEWQRGVVNRRDWHEISKVIIIFFSLNWKMGYSGGCPWCWYSLYLTNILLLFCMHLILNKNILNDLKRSNGMIPDLSNLNQGWEILRQTLYLKNFSCIIWCLLFLVFGISVNSSSWVSVVRVTIHYEVWWVGLCLLCLVLFHFIEQNI